MVEVSVKYHGVIRDVTREAAASFELPDGSTMGDLLDRMHRKYGPLFAERVLDSRIGIRSYVMFFLNGNQVEHSALQSTQLAPEDGVNEAILYVMSGASGGFTEFDGWCTRPAAGLPHLVPLVKPIVQWKGYAPVIL